jgi:hypothetical protein
MCVHPSIAACHAATHACEPGDGHAERLTALAHEARLLEFGLEGQDLADCGVASELEGALTHAMDADSADELTAARDAISAVLERLTAHGMRLTAHLSEIELDGVLGKARMPVLSAVLTA